MEVSFPGNTSICSDSRCGSEPADPHNLFQNKAEDISVSDLKTCLTELLNIDENGILNSPPHLCLEKDCIGNVERESDSKDLGKNVTYGSATGKCLSKCATFPPVNEHKCAGDVIVSEKEKHVEDIPVEDSERNDPTKPANLCYARSMSLPVPLKLISAMKGSREKHLGALPKKLSVTWGPDVYDPIPTSVSHVPADRNHYSRNSGKKSGKYRSKNSGKHSRGGKNKDKKHARKSSGGSSNNNNNNNKLKQPFLMGVGVVLDEAKVGSLDYNVGGPDPFCGSSFLKESVSKLHFPVAEAT